MGQVNRVDSANLSVERANTLADGANRTKGAVAASDAFFPFADGAEILINAGVKAIVQPGGSIRDEEVFEAARHHVCDRHPSLLPLIRRLSCEGYWSTWRPIPYWFRTPRFIMITVVVQQAR
jgi:hypothetical protein